MSVTLSDLVLLRSCGVAIDDDLMRKASAYENKHRDFAPCRGCCAVTGSLHTQDCPHGSILLEPDWYERIQRREHNSFNPDFFSRN